MARLLFLPPIDRRLVLTLAVIAASVLVALRMIGGVAPSGESQARVWFYDQSERRLYAMPRSAIPPDAGVGGESGDGVLAIVVASEGGEERIAYLQTYSPELQAVMTQLRDARESGQPFKGRKPTPDDPFVLRNTLVRRVDDAKWHDMLSGEARKLTREWRTWHDAAGRPFEIRMPRP